jgi:hypothetical protein
VVTPAPPVVDLTGSLIGEGPHVTSAETPPSTSFSMRAVRSRTRKGIYAGLGVTAAVVVALLAWPRPDGGPVESGVSSEPPVSSAPPAEAEVAEVRVAGAAAVPVAGAADVQPAPAQAAAPPVVEPSVVHVFRYPVSYRSADIAPGQGKGRRGIETELPEPERRRPPRRTPPVVAPTPAGTGLEVEWQ